MIARAQKQNLRVLASSSKIGFLEPEDEVKDIRSGTLICPLI